MHIERLRVFSDYRTPCLIRSFIKVGILAFCIFMAPYFAWISSFNHLAGFFAAVVFCWLLLCLCNIQTMLENPYFTCWSPGPMPDDINLDQLRGLKTLTASSREKKTFRKLFRTPSTEKDNGSCG